jgi:hypothetical protein
MLRREWNEINIYIKGAQSRNNAMLTGIRQIHTALAAMREIKGRFSVLRYNELP